MRTGGVVGGSVVSRAADGWGGAGICELGALAAAEAEPEGESEVAGYRGAPGCADGGRVMSSEGAGICELGASATEG